MWINTAGFCLDRSPESEKIISDACHEEIQSRITLYTKLLLSWHGEEEAISRCEELLKYFK
jgi:diketogulonate reductase-like aldo/keto reductase